MSALMSYPLMAGSGVCAWATINICPCYDDAAQSASP